MKNRVISSQFQKEMIGQTGMAMGRRKSDPAETAHSTAAEDNGTIQKALLACLPLTDTELCRFKEVIGNGILLEMEQISAEELKKMDNMQAALSAREEKILVLVRLRPLSDKEVTANEVADWERINDTTILYRNSLREGSLFPSAYSFDRVFRGDCSTRQVYEEGAKQIALSVLSGINSSIFAYGQTSSGKTYTMNGITERALADIFDYINLHEERAFVLKFSAIEIYNEAIRDLLTTDNTSLKLRDDPEKGTTVEKVTEETLRDWNHFNELVSFCEAQRQIGETSLNERSSRSHQILRLTVESNAREFLGKDNSTTLVASVNFVDLAGSERASQTLSAGTRLKEGCHINRSLLTLSTVIRKLSNGRNGHINYRDSKLTRILQPALGGNARTAIICTLSPARSHVEQTRNTLMFACCAKEVSTKAQVNVVMSDKALLKHLQKEVARLESELKSPALVAANGDYAAAALRKKDQQIQKLEKEVKEITKQRDLTQSRVEDLLRMLEDERDSRRSVNTSNEKAEDNKWEDDCSELESSFVTDSFGANHPSPPSVGQQSVWSHSYGDSNTVTNGEEDPDRFCKDVPCIESAERECASEAPGSSTAESENPAVTQSLYEEVTSPNIVITEGNEIAEGSHGGSEQRHQRTHLSLNHGDEHTRLSRNNSHSSTDTASVAPSIGGTADEEITSVRNFVARMKEMADAYEKQLAEKDVLRNAAFDPVQQTGADPSNWRVEFEMKQRMIIELWQACSVPLIHRTYFFLLFRGDPADSIYMEVELRRLSFMKELIGEGGRAVVAADGNFVTLNSSVKYLHRERAKLSKMMGKRLSREERERLFTKWGIYLGSKERKLRLCSLLWSRTDDVDHHIKESAEIIAKLVRFPDQASPLKGMLGFSFGASGRRRSLGWINTKNSLPPIPYIHRR